MVFPPCSWVVRQAAGAGRLEVVVAATFPLEDVAAAHRQGMAGHTHGQLVLIP